MNIVIKNWEKYTVKRTKEWTFSCEDLRENFEELYDMTDDQIVEFLTQTNGYVAGEHVKDACIHLSEDQYDEDIGVEDSEFEINIT